MRINEIFYSLQGEGYWTGTPAVFVRFAGCNLACQFCDTDHQPYHTLTESQIIAQITQHPTDHIIFTGGEPTLQLTASLVKDLHALGKYVHIETNGSITLDNGLELLIDWITCSPKDAPVKIQRYDEIKLLYQGDQSIPVIEKYSTPEAAPTHSHCRYLQPLDTIDATLNQAILTGTIDYIKTHPIWRLSLQTHKLLHIR